ncbi:hypothetical protein V6C42_16360 [Pseudoclostridium thermosuccinogenes]|uniref:hypothetical protein n=1 Tax=Clostridium thermosuccinogenes TaxID=84032 RepID=UPI002FD9EFC6
MNNNFYSKDFYKFNNKIIIKCVRCLNNMRVPLDKGKISVTCPVCRKEFIYNPDSILSTLKQIVLTIRAWTRRSRRNLAIFLVSVMVIIAFLFFMVFSSFRKANSYKNPFDNSSPGIEVYHTGQE